MSTEANKAIIRHYMDESFNKGNVDVFDEICAPDCFAGFGATIPQFKQYILEFRRAVPDFKLHIELMVAEGDTVVTRWRWSGTHNGAGDGARLGLMPPAGKPFTYHGISINRVVDGRIVWDIFESNWTDMLIQMGVNVMPAEKSA